jgi:hypothetical protein
MNKEANKEIRMMMKKCNVSLEDVGNIRGVTRQAIFQMLQKELSEDMQKDIMRDIADVTKQRANIAEQVMNS